MKKIKKNWLTIILVLTLLGAGYKIYQDQEKISSIEHDNYYLRSDKSILETKVIELELELEDCKSDLQNTEVIETPTTSNAALEYMIEHRKKYNNSSRSTELEND